MGKLDPVTRLGDLILPGAHHHGLVEGESVYRGRVLLTTKVLDWAVTQSEGVTGQLESGLRFLDIRLTAAGGRLVTAHGRQPWLTTTGVR